MHLLRSAIVPALRQYPDKPARVIVLEKGQKPDIPDLLRLARENDATTRSPEGKEQVWISETQFEGQAMGDIIRVLTREELERYLAAA